MNKLRREELLEVAEILDDAVDRLNSIMDDELDAFESLPEGLQMSATGEAMEDAISTMEEFESSINNVRDRIEEYAKPKKKSKKT